MHTSDLLLCARHYSRWQEYNGKGERSSYSQTYRSMNTIQTCRKETNMMKYIETGMWGAILDQLFREGLKGRLHLNWHSRRSQAAADLDEELCRQLRVLVTQSCSTLWPHGLQLARLLHPWDFPGRNTGVGCHSLLQGIFLTQGLNPDLPGRLFTIGATREALEDNKKD